MFKKFWKTNFLRKNFEIKNFFFEIKIQKKISKKFCRKSKNCMNHRIPVKNKYMILKFWKTTTLPTTDHHQTLPIKFFFLGPLWSEMTTVGNLTTEHFFSSNAFYGPPLAFLEIFKCNETNLGVILKNRFEMREMLNSNHRNV